MLVMVSLIFGSAAFAGPSGNSNGKGAEKSRTALTNHASGGNVHAIDAANENAAFYEEPPPIPEEEEDDEFALCVEPGQIIFNSDGSVTFCP